MTKEERDDLDRQHREVDETVAQIRRVAESMISEAETVVRIYREARSA